MLRSISYEYETWPAHHCEKQGLGAQYLASALTLNPHTEPSAAHAASPTSAAAFVWAVITIAAGMACGTDADIFVDYSDPAWILQSSEDQQRFWLCLASLASQDVAAAFGLRV